MALLYNIILNKKAISLSKDFKQLKVINHIAKNFCTL